MLQYNYDFMKRGGAYKALFSAQKQNVLFSADD